MDIEKEGLRRAASLASRWILKKKACGVPQAWQVFIKEKGEEDAIFFR